MRCLECWKEYLNLSVHIRQKHHLTPDIYKSKHGLHRHAPMMDMDLIESLRDKYHEGRDDSRELVASAALQDGMRRVVSAWVRGAKPT